MSDTKLPDYFPLTLGSKCRDVAYAFFAEFEKDPQSPSKQSAALQRQYEQCMEANGIDKKMVLVRVPESYRDPTYSQPKEAK